MVYAMVSWRSKFFRYVLIKGEQTHDFTLFPRLQDVTLAKFSKTRIKIIYYTHIIGMRKIFYNLRHMCAMGTFNILYIVVLFCG